MARPLLLSRPILPCPPQGQLRLWTTDFRGHADSSSRKPELLLRRHAGLPFGFFFCPIKALKIPHRLLVRGFCAAPAALYPCMPRTPRGRRVALVVDYAPHRSLDGVPTGPLLVGACFSFRDYFFCQWSMQRFRLAFVSNMTRFLKKWSAAPT